LKTNRRRIIKPGLVASIAGSLVVMLLCAGRIGAQTTTASLTLAINTTQAAAAPIPGDFSGLSFEMGSVIYDSANQGWYLSGTNANMVALMKTLGVKSVRVGGNSAETGNIATNADEDAVLDFCHAIGGNLIWDLEIDGSLYDPPGKAAIAQSMQNYVTAKNYGTNILVFQVGNEPDLTPDPNNPGHNMGVTTYDSEFSNYIAAANGLYSGSRWAGPDTAGGGTWFSGTFCPTESAAWPGQVAFVCQHDYPFGSSLDTNTSAVHISWMLAAGNEAGDQSFNNQWVPPAFAAGLAPRYEECNSFFHNGSFGASDAYASALWGLGWMYFHANAGLAGINFHMGLNANNPAYSAITPANLTTNYTVHPLAYAIAAFNLGGHGKIVPVTIGNPSSANVVAYSVLQNDGSLMVTVINREYVSQPSPPAHNAALTLSTSGTTYNAGQVMFLTGMNNDPSTTSGVTLGGSAISGSGVWTGSYMGMARPSGSSFALTVPTAQAAIIHLFNAAGPAAPTNLTATAGNSQATLTWSNSIGATGYVIQRSSTTGGSYATIAAGVTTNTYTDTGLANGSSYYYVVAATNSSGIGPQSAEAVAALANQPPLTPTGLATVPGDSVVALNWNASVGATNYILLISTNSDGSNSNLVSTLNTNYLNIGLNNGTTYYYAVSAVGPYGQSLPSALVSATPFVGNGITWTNTITASAQSWNANANWTNAAAFPNATQAVALVNSAITANQTINLNQSVLIGELNIGASGGAAAFNVAANGGTLTFDNTPGAASVTQLASSAGDTISAPLILNGSLNLYNTSQNPLTLSGNITGTNNLVVNAGTVVLGGTTTYGGTTAIAQGTLQIGSSLALQDSTLNFNSGSLTFGSGITAATMAEVTGTNGAQNLSLTNLSSGAVALTVGGDNATTNYGGQLSGTGSLTKNGTGTLTLSNANYTGATTVSGGTLNITGGTVGSSTSAFGVASTATQAGIATVSGGTLLAGSVSVGTDGNSTGALTISGNANAAFSSVAVGGANNTGVGLTVNTSGNVYLGAATAIRDNGTGLTIQNGTVTASRVDVSVNSGKSVANSELLISGGSLTITNTSSGLIIGDPAGGNGGNSGHTATLAVSGGTLTYTNNSDGLLVVNSAAAGTTTTFGNVNLTGGTTLLTGITLNKANYAYATATLNTSGGAVLYLGSVGLVLNGAANGNVAATDGTSTIGALANWSSSAPITLTGTPVAIQAADGSANPWNITLGGTLSGAGALAKTGAGTLTLTGTNTYSGATTVSGGLLLVNNSGGSGTGFGAVTVAGGGTLGGSGVVSGNTTVNSGGTLSSGNPIGTLTFSNSLALAAGSTNIFEISTAPPTNSVAKIFGALTNGGTLIVTNIAVAALTNGNSFKLFNAASYHGAFSNVILPSLPAGLGWNTNALNTSGTLSVVVITKPFIASAFLSGNGFAFTGTGGVANANFYLLGSTNLSTPVTNWTRLLTNQFDNSGDFNFSNPFGTNSQNFYMLQLQ
jgi:fibronectin-binding autotransporter adhesin